MPVERSDIGRNTTPTGAPNILLIIADDLARDVIGITGAGAAKQMQVVTNDGTTEIVGDLPNLSLLLRCGLYFSRAWAHPVCSPTRASIYTGTHPWRNGIGSPRGDPQLPASTVTALPRLLKGYQCGLFGKWHLGSNEGNRPTDHGWHKHVGTLAGRVNDYDNWTKYDSDNYANPTANFTAYATEDTVSEALQWIPRVNQKPVPIGDQTPWFATIAFHAPHEPFHVPADGFTLTTGDPASEDYMFNAMAQNLDYHVGVLLRGLLLRLSNTVIIFTGDNGSPAGIFVEEAKETIWEGGVRVPMIIADGQAVAQAINGTPIAPRFLADDKLNATSRHLVHVVDLYKTICDIANSGVGDSSPGSDSRSLYPLFTRSEDQKPVRRFNFSQTFFTVNGEEIKQATISNLHYKLNYMSGPLSSVGISSTAEGYHLFQYVNGEIPGVELYATDLFDDARSGTNLDAQENLNELMDELTSSYFPNADSGFPRATFPVPL